MSICLHDVSYSYLPGTPLETRALRKINLDVRPGEVLGVLGSVGSGKTTLLRMIKGMYEPSEGEIVLEGEAVRGPGGMARLRRATGLVMQEPELHLFAATVEEDLCFGPRNQGLGRREARERAREAMESVGLSFDELRSRNPLSLSMGEQRKVALAGVLAMRPACLLLDEITSGLDGEGKRQLRAILRNLREEGRSAVLVTHDFVELERLADRVAVLAEGRLLACGPTPDILEDAELLRNADYGLPPLLELRVMLKEKGLDLGTGSGHPEDLVERIKEALGRYGGRVWR